MKQKTKKVRMFLFVLIFMIVVPISTDSAMPENDNHKNQAAVSESREAPSGEAVVRTSQAPVAKKFRVFLTAYSSSPEETDESPDVTASGLIVQDGIVAANFLPFGAKIKIPDVFGERVFIVQDRLHKRKKRFVDIWMSSREEALEFGIKKADILLVAD